MEREETITTVTSVTTSSQVVGEQGTVSTDRVVTPQSPSLDPEDPEDTSLQDMIDAELRARMASQEEEQDQDHDTDQEQDPEELDPGPVVVGSQLKSTWTHQESWREEEEQQNHLQEEKVENQQEYPAEREYREEEVYKHEADDHQQLISSPLVDTSHVGSPAVYEPGVETRSYNHDVLAEPVQLELEAGTGSPQSEIESSQPDSAPAVETEAVDVPDRAAESEPAGLDNEVQQPLTPPEKLEDMNDSSGSVLKDLQPEDTAAVQQEPDTTEDASGATPECPPDTTLSDPVVQAKPAPIPAEVTDRTNVTSVLPSTNPPAVCATNGNGSGHDLPGSDKLTDEDTDEGVGDGTEKKKKRRVEGKDGKKLRRKKKSDAEKENSRSRSSFSHGESTEGSRIHVRSYDSAKAMKKFNKIASEESSTDCRMCGRQVFQMERIKAERAVWHKNCFRCTECNKQLTVDTYASHEGRLYCQVHHKLLFKPKAVESTDEPAVPRLRRHEMIIRESQPEELPPDVVRSSNKADYGLDELQNLNVKDRFSVFERSGDGEDEKAPTSVEVKRSESILKKMKKFQEGQGEDGVGVDLEGGSEEDSEASSEDESVPRDPDVVRAAKKNKKERPMSFSGLNDMKSRFEDGPTRRERLRQETKGELARLRGMICGAREHKLAYEEAVKEQETLAAAAAKKSLDDPSLVIQGNLKASYERACQEADSPRPQEGGTPAVGREKAASMASMFERGELTQAEHDAEVRRRREEDAALFKEAGTARGAMNLFKEMDASAPKEVTVKRTPSSTKTEFRKSLYESEPSGEVVKSSCKSSEDVLVETTAISNRFKFFEQYREPETQKRQFRFTPPREGTVKGDSPDREVEHDPSVVRSGEPGERELFHSDTAKEALNKFKQMELNNGRTDTEAVVHREKAQGNARQLLSMFRQMEESAQREDLPDGPKPLKSFTPPPEYTGDSDSEEEYTYTEETGSGSEYSDEDEDSETGPVRSQHKVQDDFLTQRTDQARSLTAKFERWEQKMERENKFNVEEECKPSMDTAKNLRAMFESMKEQPKPVEKAQPKVNRFLIEPNESAEICGTCNKRVYAMERLEVDKRILHKNCFRCSKCNCVLRMDTYTFNAGQLFCMPHFKQMFKSKGNYDEGFGLESCTKHWTNGHSEPAAAETEARRTSPERSAPAQNGSEPELSDTEGPESPVDDLMESVPAEEADVFDRVYESAVAAEN